MEQFDYKGLLSYTRRDNMSFSKFIELFLKNPERHLYTSANLIADAIKNFGYDIVIRHGEPTLSYKIFKDIFSNGTNAVFGQESCIKQIVDVIESISKESGPNRGLVLVGPPASGKTNIIDLISLALEQYSKSKDVSLYSFYYHFADIKDENRVVEIRSSFIHHPILFFTTILQSSGGYSRPRQELFEYINKSRDLFQKLAIPTYYQNASLDKRNLDIIENLLQNPRNAGKSLMDILEEYVRVEEIEFSNAQAVGISNIDDMNKLKVTIHSADAREDALTILNQHLPNKLLYQYEGALISSNRGILHIHDAFNSMKGEDDSKPLLMLLGSGKISLESTQTFLDTIVVITTNIDEMNHFEKQLTSSKLLDRIEKIPVNYLLDANSEMDILKRDMSIINEKYDVDPNLFRVAAYYSIMTRLLPPMLKEFPSHWSKEKKEFYLNITPEQKLFLYASQPDDPVNTIRKLPIWHPFRKEAHKLGLDLYNEKELSKRIVKNPNAVTLESSKVFTSEQLKLIDDDFIRELWNEHYPKEGKHGISIRQLQNIMRDTINNSDGRKVQVNTFLSQLQKIFFEGSSLHHWVSIDTKFKDSRQQIPARKIDKFQLKEGQGQWGDFEGLVPVVDNIYYTIICREIVTAIVDRDPARIEADLRKYLQYALLAQATHNKAFSHIMIPKYTFIDPVSGEKVDKPDFNFMESIEHIIAPQGRSINFRKNICQKFFSFQDNDELALESGKTVINSQHDHFLSCFDNEYSLLLSHRRNDESLDGEALKDLFFLRQRNFKKYTESPENIKKIVENILQNMAIRYGYSRSMALDTVIFALRKEIVNFTNVLN